MNDGYGRDSKIGLTLDMRNNERHISAGEGYYGWLLPLLIASESAILWFLHKDK